MIHQLSLNQRQQPSNCHPNQLQLNESVDKFAQRWREGNPIFLIRIIRGTTARLYETELQLPQGSIQSEETPNLETLNLEVFNGIFGIILSNLGQLLELKPEIVGQIGGVDIFYEPARYPEFLSQAALGGKTASRQTSPSSSTSSTSSTSSSSPELSLPSKSGLTPVHGETPIPINEVDGLRFILQSLPAEIKVKLGGEENYLPLENYYAQLVNIARKLQQLKPKQLEKIAPLNLKGLSTNEDIAQAIETYEYEVIDVEVISSEVISSEKIPSEIIHPEEEEDPRRNSTELTRFRTICGPDITRELVVVLERVQAVFNSWGGERKAEACRSLYNPESGRKAWDISELYHENHEVWIPQYQPICSTYVPKRLLNCAISVKVESQCYYAGSVNYVVFGKMCKLCQDEAFTQAWRFQLLLDDVTVTEGLFAYNPISVWLAVLLYKGKIPFVRKNAADNYEGSQKWAAAGYSGWPSGGSTPESDRPTCWPVCSIPYSHGPFTVQWGVDHF